MLTIGVDIEDISRFKDKNLVKDSKFLSRIFTDKELEYCYANVNYAPHLAARFCAKEATIKALSSRSDEFISYNKIEILKDPKGVPFINVLNDNFKNFKFTLSISHEKDKAVAFVIVED